MNASQEAIGRKVEVLESMSRDELVDAWGKNHGCSPPKGMNQPMLIRSAAYFVQSRQIGGLKRETRKALLAISAGAQHKPKPPKPELKPGMQLLREWHGVTHQVMVLEKGFEWRGEVYSSLSAVAKAITGVKWSGPRFFGL